MLTGISAKDQKVDNNAESLDFLCNLERMQRRMRKQILTEKSL
jgi:hypothetical protein